MTLRHLEIFSAVCAQESFTRAAEQLFVSQPALSHFISKAEEELGAKILTGGPRR